MTDPAAVLLSCGDDPVMITVIADLVRPYCQPNSLFGIVRYASNNFGWHWDPQGGLASAGDAEEVGIAVVGESKSRAEAIIALCRRENIKWMPALGLMPSPSGGYLECDWKAFLNSLPDDKLVP